jgi:signal transduction histidine kinase
MSARPDEAAARWLQRQAARAAELAARHETTVDIGIAILIAAASFVGLAIQDRLSHPDTIVFCLALCAPLAVRGRSRTLCFALVAGVALAQWLTSTPQIADAAVLVALYWLALDGPLAAILVAGVAAEAGAVMAAAKWSPTDVIKYWIGLSALGVAAAVVGVSIRERRALLASLQERAARLEFERDQEGRLGAAAERARIAREMHDIVSHNLTVMIGLADGASYALESSPEAASSAMRRVSATGRQALGEMRRLLGVLRDEPASEPFEPQPGLDRLDELLARVEAAGVPVSIEIVGDPHELSSGVQLAVFRVAQEALTNTLKHAGRPASARLSLRISGGRVQLLVTDTGGATEPGQPVTGTGSATEPGQPVAGKPAPPGAAAIVGTPAGRGLRGMRERAAAYGGTLEAGPMAGGGWRVALQIAADVDAVIR